jgi:hydrogenase maturation protease
VARTRSAAPARILVAGYGNPGRGDDGAGWHVAAGVRARRPPRVRVLQGQQVVPEWAPAVAEADVAYFVDASPTTTGLALAPLAAADPGSPVGAHAFGPAALLALARDVYGRAPEAFALAIPATSFAFGDRLSPATAAAVREAVATLRRLAGGGRGPG